MASPVRISIDTPDETRQFAQGRGCIELVQTPDGPLGRATFEPGWRWSVHAAARAGTATCQAAHTGYFVSGRLRVAMDGGETVDYGPGDFAQIAPGHDAWVLGDEPCVLIDWEGCRGHARA